MPKHPWSGRFKKQMSRLMEEFSESVSFDRALFEVDIMGSVAHARMLGKQGIITKKEADTLVCALGEIKEEFQAGRFKLKPSLEDVHMNVEARLRRKVGSLADKLHTARSRNDQVALDMRLYFRSQADAAMSAISELIRALLAQAEENLSAIMPGFTHTRKAQPVLFSHHLLAYVEMLDRDRERFADCRERMNFCPLGSGALAGTTFPIDREMTARELGFSGPTRNSIDSVSDRDFLLEFASAAAIAMVHLSRLMEELIWWGLPELGFVELPEEFCTGSSMMPNKMNPDAAELIRGKSGRVIGSLVALLVVMKGTPLSYNRDFQEDKEGMFDAARTLLSCLAVAKALVEGMKVNPDKMRKAAQSGFVLATEIADYLATKGLPFRKAHELTGRLVRFCEEKGKALEELSLSELRRFSPLFQEDVKEWLSLEAAVKRRDHTGATAPRQVKKELARLKKKYGMKSGTGPPSSGGKRRK